MAKFKSWRKCASLPPNRLPHWTVLLGLAILLPAPARAQGNQPPTTTQGDRGNRFIPGVTRFLNLAEEVTRFTILAEDVADLRTFEAELSAATLRPPPAGAVLSEQAAIDAAQELFGPRGFDAVQVMSKAGQLEATISEAAAEGRRRMISGAASRTLSELRAEHGNDLFIGALDSGNKASASASDIDATMFALMKDGSTSPIRTAQVIERFNAVFQAMYGHPPRHFGIEAMNGEDMYPDWRATHMTMDEFRAEASRVVQAKRQNPEAYRSEGELRIHAEGRGYEALKTHYQELGVLEGRLAEAVDRSLNPESDLLVRRIRAQIDEHQRLSPWVQFETRVDAEGRATVVEVKDTNPIELILPNKPDEPALERRLAFDGAYDNWIMWAAHPANRAKYLLLSVSDGVGQLTALRANTGRYDLDAPWRAQIFKYENVYGKMFGAEGQRAQLEAGQTRLQFIRDNFGGLDATDGGLNTERVRMALDAAAKARLRHKGHPSFANATEAQIYSDYMPDPARVSDPVQALAMARAAWESDARSIMMENLLRTVQAPGDIVRGWGDPTEWDHIRWGVPAAQGALLTPERLRAAAWLQLYHGFLDLMDGDHARQILEARAQGRSTLEVTGRPQGRVQNMVDRMVLEFDRGPAPRAAEARAELERVLFDVAARMQVLDPGLGQPRLSAAVTEVVRQELATRVNNAVTSIADWQRSFAGVRQNFAAGLYPPAVVADRVIQGTATRLAQASAGVLARMGFQGEITVRQTITYLGEVEQRGVPEFEIRFADQGWSARQALTGMATTGNADSFVQIIYAYQKGGSDAAGRQLAWEMWMNVPGISQANSVYQGLQTGNWQPAFMAGTGMLMPVVGQAYIVVNIATTSVRIVGEMVLEPLRQDDIAMAYQGFVGSENAFTQDQRGQRYNVLAPVPIRGIPQEYQDAAGETKSYYIFAEYPKEEALRVLIERSAEVDFGPIPLDTIYAVGREAGAWGGGDEWEAALPRAQDWLNNPRLNFDAKRASLYPFYRDRVNAWIRDESGADADDLEVLLATYSRTEITQLLTSFFEPITRDWAHGRGDFEGMGGGANELMIPWTAQDSIRFFGGIARHMASDLVRSYRILSLSPTVQRDTVSNTDVLLDTSHEAQLARQAYRAVDRRLKEAATRLAVMVDDARKGVEVPEALGHAVHEIRLDRNRFEDAKPHIHVRPRILAPEDTTATSVSDQVEFYVSVVADTSTYPTPYRQATEWILVETDSITADLSAVVRVYDANSIQVGDSALLELGTVRLEGPAELIALPPVVEARVGDPDEGLAPPPEAQPPEEAGPGATDLSELLIYDDIAVYFQPARDTTETVWNWRVMRLDAQGDTAVVRGGLFVPGDSTLNSTEWAPTGAPAAFVTELGSLWSENGDGPGTFVVQSCLPAPVSGLFGQTSSYAGCHGPWTDIDTGEQEEYPWRNEGSFEVGAVTLKRKGLIAEQGVVTGNPDLGPWLSVENAQGGGDGGADIVYTWDECVHDEQPDAYRALPCAEHGPEWRTVRHVERSRVELPLPNELDLQVLLMGDMEVRLSPQTEITASPAVIVDDLIPGAAADRALVTFTSTDATARLHPPSEDDLDSYPMQRAIVRDDGLGHPYHFHNDFRDEPGEPERLMGEWVRDPGAHWFLPVRLSVLSNDIYLYAVYGAEAGPYTGPIPTAPGSVSAVPDDPAAGDDPGGGGDPEDDPSGDDPVGDDPVVDDPVVNDPTVNDPAGGTDPGGPVDPNTLNPNDPDISGLIREWIGVAQPPKSVEPDNHYVYGEWGRLVGSGTDGIITPGDPPDARGTMGPVAYVWTQRDDLDSVDHCTLGGYVVRSLEGTGISDCRGRYRPSPRAPDFTGRPVAEVTRELESGGYTANVSIADWPTNPDQANTVLSQTPTAGQRLRPGTRVDLTIYGPYQEPDPEPAYHTVLNVYGLRFEDARTLLADSAFVVAEPPGGGDPAPTEDMAFRVAAQSVASGETRVEGTEIRLTLFGPYNPTSGQRRDDPPPPPPADRGPSCNDLVMAANRAQSRGDLSGAYELYRTALGNGCTNPGLGDAMDSVYQNPRCTQLIRTARTQYDQGDYRAAIQVLRDAEREGCDMAGLGPLIDGTLTALETGVAEAMGQSCSGIAAEIAGARRRGDEATAQALTTTALLQGCSGDQITTAASTPIGNLPGGGVTPSGTGGVTLTEPLSGLVTRERVIPVAGRVTVPGAERVTLVVNGEERQVSVANGEFSTMVPLVTGQNTIQAVLNSSAYSNRVTVQADVAPADVWIQLTWDGPGDIDLHLYMPDNGHVYFSHKEALGAQLDVDNTRQDGPEHITMTRAIPGEYRVEVHYYNDRPRPGAGTQVPWQVLVRLHSGQTTQRFSGTLTQQGERTDVYTFVFR